MTLDELRESIKKVPTSILIIQMLKPDDVLDEVVPKDAPRADALALAVDVINILRAEIDARIPSRESSAEIEAEIERAMREQVARGM